MRVIADTNTVVSAFLWGGSPRQVLEAAREERIQLLASPALLAELEDVLGRAKFAARIALIDGTPATLLRKYRALIAIVRPTVIATICRDPDDDQVLACALAAGAELIVSRDKDLLVLNPFQGIPILTAHEAVATFPVRSG